LPAFLATFPCGEAGREEQKKKFFFFLLFFSLLSFAVFLAGPRQSNVDPSLFFFFFLKKIWGEGLHVSKVLFLRFFSLLFTEQKNGVKALKKKKTGREKKFKKKKKFSFFKPPSSGLGPTRKEFAP
jgi:hypothetical protein